MSENITHTVNTSGSFLFLFHFFFPKEAPLPKTTFHCIKFDAYSSQWAGIHGFSFSFFIPTSFFLVYEKSWLLLDSAKLCRRGFYDAPGAPLTGFMRCEVTAVTYTVKVQCYRGLEAENAQSALGRGPSLGHPSNPKKEKKEKKSGYFRGLALCMWGKVAAVDHCT